MRRWSNYINMWRKHLFKKNYWALSENYEWCFSTWGICCSADSHHWLIIMVVLLGWGELWKLVALLSPLEGTHLIWNIIGNNSNFFFFNGKRMGRPVFYVEWCNFGWERKKLLPKGDLRNDWASLVLYITGGLGGCVYMQGCTHTQAD